jgi:diguanylate cyclase
MKKVIIDKSYKHKTHRNFLMRMFIMRQLGTTLCFISYVTVIRDMNYPSWVIVIMVVNAFVWPSWAFYWNSRQSSSVPAEYRALIIDAFFGGIWIAMMGINPFPSIMTITILIADRYSAGGFRLIRKVILAIIAGFVLTWFPLDCPTNWVFKEHIIWATLPLATVYLLGLSIMLRNIFVQLENKTKELEQLALTDVRLQIANRRHFERSMDEIFESTNKAKKLSAYLLLIDIDHFKQVNDKYGHEIGDEMLMAISTVIRQTVGINDIPARFGGDELAIIAFRNSLSEVQQLAEKILQQVQLIKLLEHDDFLLTASIGIASASKIQNATEWFRKADQALYQVKRAGRNGIFVHS